MIDVKTAIDEFYQRNRGSYNPSRSTTAKNFVPDYRYSHRQFIADKLLNRQANLSTFLPTSLTDSKLPDAE
jgi:hypothetical protein